MIVDPGVCVRDDRLPPRLLDTWSPAARTGFAAFATGSDAGSAAQPAPGRDDACGAAFAFVNAGSRDPDQPDPAALAQGVQAAALCGDDRLIADALMLQLRGTWVYAVPRPEIEARAKRAIEPVAEDKLDAYFHTWGIGYDEVYGKRVDTAAFEHDIATFERHHLAVSAAFATTQLYTGRLRRARPATSPPWPPACPALLAATADVAPMLVDAHGIAAEARWDLGDLAGAHAEMAAGTSPGDYKGRPTTGIVVDAAGHPVAGARVAAQFQDVVADRSWIGLAVTIVSHPNAVVTDRDGRFSIPVLPPVVIAAETGDGALRSHAVAATQAGNRLVLEPTRRIAGRIVGANLAKLRWPLVNVHAVGDDGLQIYGPLDRDGSFELAGVPDHPLDVVVVDGFDRPTSTIAAVTRAGDVAGVELAVAFPTRKLAVTARSASVAPLQAAFMYVVEPGGEPPRRYEDVLLRHRYAMQEWSSDESHKVIARFDGLPDGPLTACVYADFGDVQALSPELAVACVAVAAGSDAATIDVNPTPH